MDKEPLVSVILPIYNGGPYLKAAMLSIILQTYGNIEIIAINDGSTDDSLGLLKQFESSDSRIRIVSRENRGLVATLNEGLDVARGQLIARMDCDDVAYPNRLAMQVAAFNKRPELCMVAMHADFLFPRNRVLRTAPLQVNSREIQILNIFSPFFIHPTVMLSAEFMSRTGMRYRSQYVHSEDFDMWRRITSLYPVEYITQVGLAWRQGHNSVRSRHFRDQCLSHARIVDEQLSSFGIISKPNRLVQSLQSPDIDGAIGVLSTVRQYIDKQTSNVAAFESGFSNFSSWLFVALCFHAAPYEVMRRMEASKLSYTLPRRDRLLAHLSRIMSAGSATALVETARNCYRRSASVKLARAITLPEQVMAALSVR